MKILGIETSCDETGIAIYDEQQGLLSHQLYSQVALHAEYGGVVPELASRDHITKALPLIEQALQQAKCQPSDLSAIAYTAGPGLMGALLVGASLAKGLAYAWQIPAIGVHHMEGHLLAPMLEEQAPRFPFVALLVSGGHSLFVAVRALGDYQILGESLDDAAGEAFDKTAKILGLGYPGGPSLAKLAEQGQAGRFKFPRPMTDRPGLDLSFSGLKTHTANCIANEADDHQTRADIAYAFQEAVCDTLAIKSLRALKQTGYQRLVVAGGVSANQMLRQRLRERVASVQAEVFYPRPEFCTDNGAMIALAGLHRFKQSLTSRQPGSAHSLAIEARPRWPIDELTPIL